MKYKPINGGKFNHLPSVGLREADSCWGSFVALRLCRPSRQGFPFYLIFS